jgi:hypothetical protein
LKKHQIDILPSPAAIVRERTGFDKAEFERAVRSQVVEIMAERDAIVFEPFFRSRQVAYELKRLQSVPEQEKFSVSYERYGCMICETHATPHAGNGLCQSCRSKWFRRFAQIIGEGIKGEPAQRARGTARAERLLPGSSITHDPHRTYYERSSQEELKSFGEIADRLGVSPDHVREVARGGTASGKVAAALEEKGFPLHPRASANLEKRRTRELYARVAARLGVTVRHVQQVILGHNTSAEVVAALAEEGVHVPDSGKPPQGFHPNSQATLARLTEERRNRTAAPAENGEKRTQKGCPDESPL